jgi:hypothetical protein
VVGHEGGQQATQRLLEINAGDNGLMSIYRQPTSPFLPLLDPPGDLVSIGSRSTSQT